jgi:hypothetical protein
MPINYPTMTDKIFIDLDDNPDIILNIDLITAVSVLTHLQLALRHPLANGNSASVARDFGIRLQAIIVKVAPSLEDVFNMGWGPNHSTD